MTDPRGDVRRVFADADQWAFATLSGDYNPIHLDARIARRSMFGRPIVHGLHLLLWALDLLCKDRPSHWMLNSLSARFKSAIPLNSEARVVRTTRGEMWRLEVVSDDAVCTSIELTSQAVRPLPCNFHTCPPPEGACAPSRQDYGNASGRIPLHLDPGLTARLFPQAARYLPALQLANLLATTRTVGMECPGLNSLYTGLDVDFTPEAGGVDFLSYHTYWYDETLRSLQLSVDGPGMSGVVSTFVRPAPQEQLLFSQARAMVDPNEFKQDRALVVGGSRGLGEATAKLLAAGGASVVVTWAQGEEDARRVVEEIRRGGGEADACPCDVRNFSSHSTTRRGQLDALYYFATPYIRKAKPGHFSSTLFLEFSEYYVTGFYNMIQLLFGGRGDRGHYRALYPSTVYVEDCPPGLAEYAAAKAAGEAVAGVLATQIPGLVVHAPRLPRLPTDQTLSLIPGPMPDTGQTMLNVLRDLDKRARVQWDEKPRS